MFSQKLRIETVNTIHNNLVYMMYRIVSSLSNPFSVHMLKKARITNSAHSSPVSTMAAVNQEATVRHARQVTMLHTNQDERQVIVDSVHSIALFHLHYNMFQSV